MRLRGTNFVVSTVPRDMVPGKEHTRMVWGRGQVEKEPFIGVSLGKAGQYK